MSDETVLPPGVDPPAEARGTGPIPPHPQGSFMNYRPTMPQSPPPQFNFASPSDGSFNWDFPFESRAPHQGRNPQEGISRNFTNNLNFPLTLSAP